MKGSVKGACLSALLVWSSAALGVEVSLPSGVSSGPGTVVQVPVRVDAVAGLVGYVFTVSFAPPLVFQSAQPGGLTAGWGNPSYNVVGSSVTVGGFSPSGAAGGGSIAVLRFTIPGNAANGAFSVLALSDVELNDGALAVTTVNGSVTVQRNVAVRFDSQPFILRGAEFDLPLVVDDADGVVGYFFKLHYDPQDLELMSFGNGDLPADAGWSAPLPPLPFSTPGNLSVAAYGSTALHGPGNIVNLHWRVPNTATEGPVYIFIDEAELNDGNIPALPENGQITVLDENTLPAADSAGLFLLMFALGCIALQRTVTPGFHPGRILHARVRGGTRTLPRRAADANSVPVIPAKAGTRARIATRRPAQRRTP